MVARKLNALDRRTRAIFFNALGKEYLPRFWLSVDFQCQAAIGGRNVDGSFENDEITAHLRDSMRNAIHGQSHFDD